MKVSFDGMRKSLAHDFNALVQTVDQSWDTVGDGFSNRCAFMNIQRRLNNLATDVNAMMCLYDNDVSDDFNEINIIIERCAIMEGE